MYVKKLQLLNLCQPLTKLKPFMSANYEHQKAERAGYKRSRPAIRARKADSVANELVLNPLAGESQTTEDQSPI